MTKPQTLLIFLTAVCIALPASAQRVVNPPDSFSALGGDAIPTQSTWLGQITNIYNWVNNNLAGAFNILTTKGDSYAFDGVVLTRVGIGSNGQYYSSDGTVPQFRTITPATIDPLTKGALPFLNADGSLTSLPPGLDTYVLTVSNAASAGVAWVAPGVIQQQYPKGAVISWSPAAAGTNTIPAGFALCDGSVAPIPNLIGMFVVGGRMNNGTDSAASGGYGIELADGLGRGGKTHQHSASIGSTATITHASVAQTNVTLFRPPSHVQNFPILEQEACAFVLNFAHGIVAEPSTIHSMTLAPVTTGNTTVEPADYSLVYIVKL